MPFRHPSESEIGYKSLERDLAGDKSLGVGIMWIVFKAITKGMSVDKEAC